MRTPAARGMSRTPKVKSPRYRYVTASSICIEPSLATDASTTNDSTEYRLRCASDGVALRSSAKPTNHHIRSALIWTSGVLYLSGCGAVVTFSGERVPRHRPGALTPCLVPEA